MSKYTVELRHIVKNVNIFENCDFYTDNETIKNNFERKFIDHYFFHEIGFETIGRFKQRLKSRLNTKMPYYTQLYLTELECKEINFMLNKDLTETLERDLTGNINSISSISSNDNSTVDTIESNIENGNASIELTKGSLTNVSKNTSENDVTTNNNSEDTTSQKEIVTSKSQGNIGITSSADLLDKWRKVIINIDEMIIEDCYDLFMQVY